MLTVQHTVLYRYCSRQVIHSILLPLLRFVADVGPGEMIFFPPFYYHATKIIKGTSLAAAYNMRFIPFYGDAIQKASLWKSPLGLEGCVAGKAGFRFWSKQWDEAFRKESDAVREL